MARRNTAHSPGTVEDTQVLDGGSTQARTFTHLDAYEGGVWPGGIEPTMTVEWRTESARLSIWAGLGLVVSVVALCATLTGLLAPEGAAVGVLGFLISIGGLVASGSPATTGRGVAGLALLVSAGAVALAVVAMSGRYSWPNSRTNEISTWHAWFVDHWPWLSRW